MLETVKLLLVFLVGLAAGFADSTVGSGGLMSIPFLIFLGLPPQVAIATDRLGSVGQTFAALFAFHKAKKIRWAYVPIFTILAIAGSIIGANILLTIDPKALQKIVGIILIIMTPLIFAKRSLGVQSQTVGVTKKFVGLLFYFLIMIYNGFFGTGAGPLASFNTLYFFGFTIIEANATSVIPWFVLSISSLIIFTRSGIVNWPNGIVLLVGMTMGGYLGAHVAIKKGDGWIKQLFGLVIIISCIKLLFF